MPQLFFTNFQRANTLLSAAWLVLLLLTACHRAPPTDMRRLVPRETLVYLETKDVGALLESLSASPAFQTLVKDQPDYSALVNVQAAVAVSGFETSAENSALNLKPRFVAVIETHAWNWQAVSLAENQIDVFVRKSYGAAAAREASERDDGRFYTWTAADKRRVFAFVRGSLIYFGNDAATIERFLAVAAGAAENLTLNESLARVYSNGNAAFGYVSSDGIKQIADLAGVSVAVSASEETDGRSFIARVVPQILQNTTREIVWTMNAADGGIEDKYTVNLTAATAKALTENLNAGSSAAGNFAAFIPPEIHSATRYNLKNPLTAWRESLSLTVKNTDALSGKILVNYSNKLLEPYGVRDAEMFLSAVSSPMAILRLDAEGDRSVLTATVGDAEKLKSSISSEIDFRQPPEKISDAEIRYSDDKNLAAAFVGNVFLLGDGESVRKCLRVGENGSTDLKNQAFQRFSRSSAMTVTFGRDDDAAGNTVKVLGSAKDGNRRLATFYTTETRLTADGFERVTVSDFGLLGALLRQLN